MGRFAKLSSIPVLDASVGGKGGEVVARKMPRSISAVADFVSIRPVSCVDITEWRKNDSAASQRPPCKHVKHVLCVGGVVL